MKVKFTDPLNDRQVLFGGIVEMNNSQFWILGDNGETYVINPNSDYNFRFIPNEEADNKFQEALNVRVDEMEALEKKSKRFC